MAIDLEIYLEQLGKLYRIILDVPNGIHRLAHLRVWASERYNYRQSEGGSTKPVIPL